MPLVSVIIVVFNQGPFLTEALESVVRQERPADEVIVVDDGSTDGGTDRLDFSPWSECGNLQLVRQPRRGPGAARNRGVALAQGDWIAFLDADDVWHQAKLKAYLDHLAGTDTPVAFGHFRYFHAPNEALPPRFQKELLDRPHLGRIPSTLMVRRHAFATLGGFDEALKTAEDVEWLSRVQAQRVPQTIVPGVYLHKRVHRDNLSLTAPSASQDLFAVLRRTRRGRAGRRGNPQQGEA